MTRARLLVGIALALWALPLAAQPLAAQPAKRAPSASPGVNQLPPPPPEPEPGPQTAADAAPPHVLALPPDELRAIQTDPAYRYDDPVLEPPSLWARLKAAVVRLLERMFEAVGPTGFKWIGITLGVVAVGWALARLLRADVGGLFGRDDRRADAAGPLLDVEDIAEVDLAALLAEARARYDYRAALRLRYLLLLQTLAAAGAIVWARDKTNRTYATELRAWDAEGGGPLAPPFARATRLFERVWYGGLDVTEARFVQLDADADAVERALAPVPA